MTTWFTSISKHLERDLQDGAITRAEFDHKMAELAREHRDRTEPTTDLAGQR